LRQAVCLLFHDVYERDPEESGFPGAAAARYKLRRPDFEAQLEALERARVGAPILIDALPRGGSRPPVVITVDDGGVSFYTTVAPLLEARGWHAHCFVTTGWIGHPGFLDRGQLQELHRRGHAIGSHSVSHPPRFSACSWEQMVREWRDSGQTLADILGVPVTTASVPGGYYSPQVAAAAREAGYHFLCTSEPVLGIRVAEGCTVLGRYTIRRGAPAGYAARLAELRRTALLREWMAWNGKKLAKRMLGPGYPWLARRV
jgi:peptidoglycan/xylan/chitin deacetylase (PgdA/CDA1 family)